MISRDLLLDMQEMSRTVTHLRDLDADAHRRKCNVCKSEREGTMMEKRKPSENVTDDWNIKYVKVGDPFECKECGEEGVFDLDRQLGGAIAPSEYVLGKDDVSRLFVCAACEEERQKLAKEEYEATLCLWECDTCKQEREKKEEQ